MISFHLSTEQKVMSFLLWVASFKVYKNFVIVLKFGWHLCGTAVDLNGKFPGVCTLSSNHEIPRTTRADD